MHRKTGTRTLRALLFTVVPALLLLPLLLLPLLFACAKDGETEPEPAPEAEGVYTIRLTEAVAGFTFTFCTGDICVPVSTGEDGVAVFEGTAAEYEVKLIRSANGYEADFPDARIMGPASEEILVEIKEAAS